MLDFKQAGIGALVFYVKSIDRTVAFYRDVLGLDPSSVGDGDESFVMARTGSTLLLFFVSDERPGKSPIVVFSAQTGGIDDLYDRLVARGVRFVLPVSPAPDGGLTTDFLDPDDHVLSIHQPPGAPRRIESSAIP